MADEHKDEHAGGHGDSKEGHGGGHKKHGGHHGGGGHAEHEEGVPEWVVSFADNALLQMGFFVIMFAMNVGPKAKGENPEDSGKTGYPSAAMADALIAIREAFNSPLDLNSANPNDAPLIERMRQRLAEEGQLTEGAPGSARSQQAIRPSDYNNVTASFPFDVNAKGLSESNRELARSVADKLRGQTYVIEVRGHVSAVEAAAGQEAALRLSFQRAQSVAQALVENGIKWSNLRIAACADHDRKTALAYDAAGHRTNQRAEIVVTNETVAADPHVRDKAD